MPEDFETLKDNLGDLAATRAESSGAPAPAACDIRGDVEQRLRRPDEGRHDDPVLAAAWLMRPGFADRISRIFTTEGFPPAPWQGSPALLGRCGDTRIHESLKPLNLGCREDLP